MPSVSKKQHNFMAAVAKNPGFAKKVGIPRSVGQEFLTADKGKTFKEGGTMKKMVKKMSDGGMPMVMKDGEKVPAFAADGKGKMAKGGMTKHEDIKMDKKVVKKAVSMHDKQLHGGKKTNLSKLARGGGVEMKGKTKGKMIKMNKGGKSC
jgi:hypothetical protein